MAIIIAGTPFNDLKDTAYNSRDQHDVAVINRTNAADALLNNIRAATTSGTTLINSFPNMSQVENDICSWY